MLEPYECREGINKRNLACPHYMDCLDQAAQSQWEGFLCTHCSNRDLVRQDWRDIQVQDAEGLGDLLVKLWRSGLNQA